MATTRPDDRPRVVHGAVKAEYATSFGRRRQTGQHRVAWRAANAFSGAIKRADEQHLRPALRERDERPCRG